MRILRLIMLLLFSPKAAFVELRGKPRPSSSLIRIKLGKEPVDAAKLVGLSGRAAQASPLLSPADVDISVHIRPEQIRPMLDDIVTAAASSDVVDVAGATELSNDTAVFSFVPSGTADDCQNSINQS